ncbi:MAG: GTPase ObgE, partial [Verrucomicrobiae bacterium]|nr:GTPase ObgE [Verrucomicrobiae bacterium]
HVERCRFLLVLLDASGSDNREPWDDYRCLLNELELYRADLVERPRLVVANKMDLPEAADKISKLRRKVPERLVEISADKDTGVGKILSILHKQFFETSVR